jgi:hypothetical protein
LEAESVPPSLNFLQLDFVKLSSGFHPATWECVKVDKVLEASVKDFSHLGFLESE